MSKRERDPEFQRQLDELMDSPVSEELRLQVRGIFDRAAAEIRARVVTPPGEVLE